MARHINPTEEQKILWENWLAERPAHVKIIAAKFDPWTLYRMKSTGQRVYIIGFDENENDEVTVRVGISGKYNFLTHERNVFGIDANDLVECDLPKADEMLGNMDLPIESLRSMMSGGST